LNTLNKKKELIDTVHVDEIGDDNDKNEMDSSESSNEDLSCDISPTTQLAQWAIKHNISNVATSDLLKILNTSYDSTLPIDARSLLKTDFSNINIPLKDVMPGKYFHFGIANGVKNHYIENIESTNLIKLVVGIDGLPLTKSSKSTFWPILCYIRPHSNVVFPIGLYWGYDKPNDSNDFLRDFYDEIICLINNGIDIKNKSGVISNKKIVLDTICCDVPAKSFVLKTKGHSGFYSCTRCCTEGEYINRRVSFPDLNCPKRTHEHFINKQQEDHHIGSTLSILTNIPEINIINVFSLDYMHLICLGVTKKLINLWLKGPLKNRLNSAKCKLLSNNLITLKHCIPIDFQRKPRGIDEVSRWKATEFRTFLLYLGPVVLVNIVNKKCYLNFLCFHVSIFILLKSNINKNYLDFSKKLLNYFIVKFISIYGREWVSHNVHSLQHISDDYIRFGSLDNSSAFPFENHMNVLKKYVRKTNQPLQQAVKRYSESISYNLKSNKTEPNLTHFTFKNKHTTGQLLPELNNYFNFQYKTLIFKNTEIRIDRESDNYLQMNDGNIIKVINIISQTPKEGFILGYCFEKKEPFYNKPIDSSKLDIFAVANLNNNFKSWSVNSIKCKCMILKVNSINKIVAFPLLHTYNI